MLHEITSTIINAIAGLLAGFLILRFWMQALRVRPPNQIAQAIFQTTDWIVQPLRRMIPGVGGYDWASVIATILVALLASLIECAFLPQLRIVDVVVLAVFMALRWFIYGLILLIVLEVILSWINPHAPLAPFVHSMNAPILAPIRKLLPSFGGMDFSPLVALLVLQIALMVLTQSLRYL